MTFDEIIKEIDKPQVLTEGALTKEQKRCLVLSCNEKTLECETIFHYLFKNLICETLKLFNDSEIKNIIQMKTLSGLTPIDYFILNDMQMNESINGETISLLCSEKINVDIDIINILGKLNRINSCFVEEINKIYPEKLILKNCNNLFNERNDFSTGKRIAIIPLLTEIAIKKKDLSDEDNSALLLFFLIPFKYQYEKFKKHLCEKGSSLIYKAIIEHPIYEYNKSKDLEDELYMLKLKYERYLLNNTIISNQKKQIKRV